MHSTLARMGSRVPALPYLGYTYSVEPFDLIVIGGGIAGLGVAREAARHKLKTAVLEAGSCGRATSDNTLRIIHGGFRYLQNGDIPRVVKSIRDQRAVLREFADAVAPLPCLMPLSRFGLKSRLPASCAALLYRLMMRLCGSELPAPKIMSSRDVDLQVPLLRGLAPYGALCWHDVVMLQPHKLVEVLTEECLRGPVTVLENRRVTGVSVASGMYEVQDASGSCHHARAVVSTLGPFLSSVALPAQLAGERPLWAKGFNVTISRQLEASFGVGVQGDSGRLFFCLPRGSGTAIGTWYVPWAAGSGPLSVSEEEIEDLVSAFNAALPGANVHRSEVASVDVGLLPMQSDSPQGPVLVANERIHAVGRYAEVLSTKYTIFRSQGRKALAAVSKGLV